MQFDVVTTDRAEIEGDADLLDKLIAKTPGQAEQWIDATVTDLASAKQVLKKMAKLLVYLARRAPNK